MRKLAGLLILSMALAVVACPPVVAMKDPAAEQAAQLKELRIRIGTLKKKLSAIRGKRDVLHVQLEATEKKIGAIATEMRRLEGELDKSRKRLKSLDEERSEQEDTLAAMRLVLARDLRAAYASGRQEQVKLLLNQEDPAAIGRMMVYHGYFTRARAERMQRLRASLQRLESIEKSIIQQRQQLEQLFAEQQQQAAHLASKQQERENLLAGLQSELKHKSSELDTLEQNEQRLEKLVQELQNALRDIPPATGQFKSLKSIKGALNWPVTGRIRLRYGEKPSSGKLRARGVLIAARAGDEVHAISGGRVAFADWLRGFGLLLIIDHGEGYMSLYGHNRSLYKEVGEWLEKGDVIAAVGNSGGQLRPGLYLELRKNGRPFNPAPWFAGTPASLRAEH